MKPLSKLFSEIKRRVPLKAVIILALGAFIAFKLRQMKHLRCVVETRTASDALITHVCSVLLFFFLIFYIPYH